MWSALTPPLRKSLLTSYEANRHPNNAPNVPHFHPKVGDFCLNPENEAEYNLSMNLSAFFHELDQRIIGEVRTDTFNRMFYATDASLYQVMPHGVLIPRHAEDMQAAVELAAKHHVPLVSRGGGSSLVGQTVNEALIIDTTRYLDNILELNVEERWVRVQPGLVLDQLNLYLKAYGLQFGPDPASSNRAAMGGIVSNNATGSHSILYGMTADHVLETKVILDDGTIATFSPLDEKGLRDAKLRAGREGEIYTAFDDLITNNTDIIRTGTPHHWRRCGGYNLDRFVEGTTFNQPRDSRFNLAKILCGAEGTLGAITELKLALVPRPKQTTLAIIPFDTLPAALKAVPIILETNPSAVELLDNLGLTMCREVPEYARLLATFLTGQPNCVLITEFYGENDVELHAKVGQLRDHLRANLVPCGEIIPAHDPRMQANVWTVRKVGLGLLMSVKSDYKPVPIIEDSAVPVEHLAEYIARIETYCNDLGTDVAYYAHASAGCLHVRPLLNTKLAREVDKLPLITQFAAEILGEYGGAFSSEHGDGRARSWLNQLFFGDDLYQLYRQTKRIFDPHNIFNPGNLVDSPAMTEHLRYGATYETIPLNTFLDFSADNGFHAAVEMCNGAGVCRKRTTGTMCPSFMATREEEHSTRGRANALRNALSGRIPHDDLLSERMYETMDLCISCKACKAECPSSVDMAKIKLEFQGQYFAKHGIPLRNRFFGHIAALSRVLSGPLAPLVNWSTGLKPVQWGMEKMLGVSTTRTLPKFASQPFTHWFAQHKPHQAARPVVLFNDTFNTHNDPHIAIAATEVLETLNFSIRIPGHGCCGRPMMSKGLVDAAKAAARDTVETLAPFARAGIPIVGLEPSCILSLRDEYEYLLPDHPDVAIVAEHAYTFEEFIAQLVENDELGASFSSAAEEILLHGHCHQKALVGTAPSLTTLGLLGCAVSEIDSACCGMAGSFGYEVEHQEVSEAMAEHHLLPTIRAHPNATIVAAGTSCRHQIEHFTGRRAYHPAEVLRDALKNT